MAKGKYQEWLTEEGLTLIEGWARNGLTDEQIAHNIGINVKTLYDWKKKYSPISNALKNGKEVVDLQVENALLNSALGFKYTEQAITNKGDVVTVERFQAPNTTAQIFWLKNRKPNEWRDKRETQLSGAVETNTNPLQGLTTDELKKLIRSD